MRKEGEWNTYVCVQRLCPYFFYARVPTSPSTKEPQNQEIIRFTFGKAGIVSVYTEDIAGENILVLHQENIPTDEASIKNFFTGCQTGWTFYLLNLKSIALGGLDLRNKNNALNMD